jgi:tryptophan-rich sensory protein
MKTMNRRDIWKLVLALAVPQAVGGIGALFTTPAIGGWYAGLARPEFAPPNWVFGPVWTALFALMGIAAFLVWKRKDSGVRVSAPLILFGIQLFLNALWSFLFFGLRSPGGAFIEIILLWLAIGACILSFAKFSRTAAWLMVPYIAWVSFAGYLNYAIWALN